MSDVFYDIVMATINMQQAQLQNEQTSAVTTDEFAKSLYAYYDWANQQLKADSDAVTTAANPPDGKPDASKVQAAETKFNLDNQIFQNFENTFNTTVQASQTQTQQVAQDQRMTVQFSTDAVGVESYLGNLLSSRLG